MSRIGPLALVVALGLVIGGCTENRTQQEANERARTDSPDTDPKNTAINERDRTGAYPTPDDQMGNERDMTLTQALRQAIMEDNTMSTDAQNIKIITMDGKMMLRGPVKSEAEKAAIASKAQLIAGTTPVDNQLEVAAGD